MPCVVRKNGMIELRDQLLARPVPELENWRNEADARHVGDQLVVQQVKRRRMGGRGARIGLQAAVVVEQPHRQSAAAKKPGAQQPNRPAAGDQNSAFVIGHEC